MLRAHTDTSTAGDQRCEQSWHRHPAAATRPTRHLSCRYSEMDGVLHTCANCCRLSTALAQGASPPSHVVTASGSTSASGSAHLRRPPADGTTADISAAADFQSRHHAIPSRPSCLRLRCSPRPAKRRSVPARYLSEKTLQMICIASPATIQGDALSVAGQLVQLLDNSVSGSMPLKKLSAHTADLKWT